MGVVRIDDNLKKQIQDYINIGENKYQYPTISAFINNAIYEKLKRLNGDNNEKR